MKNIWIINHYGEPPTTGKNIRHYNFAKNLIKKNYRVKIFTASTIHTTNINYIQGRYNSRKEVIQGVPFVFIRTSNYEGNGKKRIKNILEYSYRILNITKKYEKPDVIYASSPHSLTWLSAYLISKRYKCKFIVETRDLWPETFVSMGQIKKNSMIAKVLYFLEKFIYKRADELIFTFPGGKDYINNIGLETPKVNYINNGIDLDKFNYERENNIFYDEDLDEPKIFKVIYVGSISKSNAIDNIVKAAETMKERNLNNIKFYIFGDGFERKVLEKYVKENSLNNIKFKGRVEKKYIPNILSKADLNLFSLAHLPNLFKYGISPNKMFDYFASGNPTVSNVETGYDLLEKYNCGITVKGNSVEALVEGIIKFYKMPHEEYNKYCRNALKAAKNFDFKVLTDKLEKLL